MSNINNIKIGTDTCDSIMFDTYSLQPANQDITLNTLVTKDFSRWGTQDEGEWEINDGWDVEFVDEKTIKINKFKIDTWGIRHHANSSTDAWSKYYNLQCKVSGLTYVNDNIIKADAESDEVTGFTDAYVGSGGYVVSWYPGQFTTGRAVKGLVIQGFGCYGDTWNTARDLSYAMGRAPWEINNSREQMVADGTRVRGMMNGGGCTGICIGLFGGCQTVVIEYDEEGNAVNNVYDESTGAYKEYDISDTPIYIYLDVGDLSKPVDITTVECWDAHIGGNTLYHKDKTLENCWKKYGLASETYVDSNGDTQEYGYIKVANVSGLSFDGGLIVPQITDLEEHIANMNWNIAPKNSEFWDPVKEWFANNNCTLEMLERGKLFGSSNIDEVTLNLNDTLEYDDGTVTPYYFMYANRPFDYSSVKKINLKSDNGCFVSSGNGFFIHASSLTEITMETVASYIFGATDVSGMFSMCALSTYPAKLINWSENRSNAYTHGEQCTLFQYFCDYSGSMVEIPSYNENDRFADSNTIIPASVQQSFNGCGKLKVIGPVLDFGLIEPLINTSVFASPMIEDMRLKNLNHGDWNFDGVTRTVYHGNLPMLNQESIDYLFENLTDMGLYSPEENQDDYSKCFKNWDCSYKNSNDSKSVIKYSWRVVSTRQRFANGVEGDSIVWTNNAFGTMTINVVGMKEGDRLEFGSGTILESDSSITENGVYTITKETTTWEGFKLYNDDTSLDTYVWIAIVDGYDPRNPIVSAANLYCPVEWRQLAFTNPHGWYVNTAAASRVSNIEINLFKRYLPTASAGRGLYCQGSSYTYTNFRFKVEGLLEGDTLFFGLGTTLANQSNVFTEDGEYTIDLVTPTDSTSTTPGFGLYNEDTSLTDNVLITVLGCDEYTNKVSDELVSAANEKGWTIYVGGELVEIE